MHPGKPRRFEHESTRWRVIADGLGEVLACVPRNERRTFVILAECQAYAKHRLEVIERTADPVGLPLLFEV